MLHVIQLGIFFHHWIFHPLVPGPGYNFWSGIAGSFLTSLPGWFLAIMLFLRHTNCHSPRCPRVGKFHVEGTPYKLCKIHHPSVPNDLTLEHIHAAHREATNGAMKVREGV